MLHYGNDKKYVVKCPKIISHCKLFIHCAKIILYLFFIFCEKLRLEFIKLQKKTFSKFAFLYIEMHFLITNGGSLHPINNATINE